MAKKNTGAIVAGVVGLGALGLGAVMLSQQKTGNNKDITSLFSGLSGADSGYVGGGATGGYGEIVTPTETVSPSVSDTVGEVLTEVLTQTQTPTQQPVFITPKSNPQETISPIIPQETVSPIIPQIQEIDNPADETADVKQTDYTTWQNIFAAGGDITGNLQAAGWNVSQPTGAGSKSGLSNGAQALIAGINADKGAGSSSSAVEYSPFNFAPTPKQSEESKQADYSSYNAGKTGGSAANTPTTPAKTPTTPAKTPTTPAKTPTTPARSPTPSSSSMPVTSPVQTAVSAFSSAVGAVASNVGSFLSGLFGR